MAKQISNEEEFKENLKKLGELYEEGKDLVNTSAIAGTLWADKIHGVLQQMRDIAAVQMQHKHWLNEN